MKSRNCLTDWMTLDDHATRANGGDVDGDRGRGDRDRAGDGHHGGCARRDHFRDHPDVESAHENVMGNEIESVAVHGCQTEIGCAIGSEIESACD